MDENNNIIGPAAEVIPFGRRLLNSVIDERAAAGHSRPYASIPKSSILSEGFQDISYETLANAVNRCAHWLRKSLGLGDEETIVYIGPADLRYQILSLSAVKSGYVMFFPSPRNTADALNRLLDEANATKLIVSSDPPVVVKTMMRHRSMQCIEICSLAELLDDTPVEAIPFNGTFDEYRFKPWVKLHTSGSTGFPKIIPIKHGLVSAVDTYNILAGNEVPARYGNMRVFIPFPPFHMAGVNYPLPVMLWMDSTVVFPPPGAIVTAELVHSIHVHGRVEHSMLAPSLISDLAHNSTWREDFAKLKGLTYSGGPLSDDVASIVSQHTKITSSMGATEYGGIPMLPKDPLDWKYFHFNEAAAGLRFDQTEQPGLYELVFVRQPSNSVSNLVQAIFVTFPDLDVYRTKDCFTKHSSKPGLWKYESRRDDIIVLSNGEKVNPVRMEGVISSCPAINGCLIVGQGKFQTALIIERKQNDMSIAEVSKALESFIDKANALCPPYGRVAYHNIILTTAGKPLPRAPKGTIQRSSAVKLYATEIEECYAALETVNSTASMYPIKLGTTEETEKSVTTYLSKTLGLESDTIGGSDDLFDMGLDSLGVISIVRALNGARPKTQRGINPAFIYDHPTVEKLALALASGARVKIYSDFDEDDEDEKQTWRSMESIFQELRTKVDKDERQRKPRNFSTYLRSTNSAPLYQEDGGILAWKQVLGSFLINVSNWGLVNSFGVYQAYYQTTLTTYSPSAISWIGTVQGTLLLVVGVVSGPLFDRGYFRAALLLAGTGLVLGLMMLSLATEYYQIMLSQGVLIGLCSGLLYIPSVAVIPLYFKRRRGLALGLATSGGSLGGILYPIVFRRVLEELGFGWATRVLGFLSFVTLASAALLLEPIGARSTRDLFDYSAIKDLPYVSFALAGFFLFAGVLVPYFTATTYGLEALSSPEDLSFYYLAILNAAQLFGRILPAFLSDWIGPEILLLGAEVMAGVMGFCWIAVNDTAGYVVWLLAFGFVSGMNVTLPPAVLPYICPSLAVIGTRLGMLYAVAGLGFLISSPVAFALDSNVDGFLGAQCWIGACCLTAAVFYMVTTREAWKRRKLYEENGQRRTYLVRRRDQEKTAV